MEVMDAMGVMGVMDINVLQCHHLQESTTRMVETNGVAKVSIRITAMLLYW